MRATPPALLLVAFSLFAVTLASPSLQAQQSTAATPASAGATVCDTQALTVLQRAVAAMGGSAPLDSTAAGTIEITAGTRTESGSFTLLTRGVTQSAERIAAAFTAETRVYSGGWAALTVGQSTQTLSIEGSLGNQSVIFPLPFLLNALSDTSLSCEYLGTVATDSVPQLHIRFWHQHANKPGWRSLVPFTVVDVWIDPNSTLPLRISYGRLDRESDMPTLSIDVFFSRYQNFAGVLYPMNIKESWNGTPWAEITIQSVALNSGLTDSNFPVVMEAE